MIMTAAASPTGCRSTRSLRSTWKKSSEAASRTNCATAPRLQRALAHPWNVWVYFMDHDIAVLAARLYTSLADAHAFAAGNKRTAFRAAVAFVEANGYAFDMPPQRHPIDRLLGYFDGRLGQSGVVEWFRLWMTPRLS